MKKAVIGIVDSAAQAEILVNDLQREASIRLADISVLLPDRRDAEAFARENHTKAPEGAVAGASAGGLLGGTLGLLVGIGALAIPGVGPLIAAGPVLAALSGVAAGVTLGGISGALVGMGIPETEARDYERKLREGSVLVAVHTESSEEQRLVRDLMRRDGAHDIDTRNESTLPRDMRDVR
ncbi:MAG TPA: DUF3341 domain-containing protein [Polyangiales bacterium]